MPRNYDTTNGRPYPRVTEINITYSALGVPRIEYVERIAIVDADKVVNHFENTAQRHVLDLSAITEPVQCVHSATGQPIPGMTVTRQQLMLGLLGFLRADQLRRDAQQEAAQAVAQHDEAGDA